MYHGARLALDTDHKHSNSSARTVARYSPQVASFILYGRTIPKACPSWKQGKAADVRHHDLNGSCVQWMFLLHPWCMTLVGIIVLDLWWGGPLPELNLDAHLLRALPQLDLSGVL